MTKFKLFNFILIAHLIEHILQCIQIYILHWSPMVAGGLLGLIYLPAIHNEYLHFSFAGFHLIGLIYFRNKFKLNPYYFLWSLAIYWQVFHFSEHVTLLTMYFKGVPMNIRSTPLQIWIGLTRAQIHLLYNFIGMIPITIALKQKYK